MKMLIKTTVFALVLLAGCSNSMNRNWYEGFKSQSEANRTPAERASDPSPSYDAYSKEREKLKKTEEY